MTLLVGIGGWFGGVRRKRGRITDACDYFPISTPAGISGRTRIGGDKGAFLAIELRAVDAQAVQDLRHEPGGIILSLTVAQGFRPAEIIAHTQQPMIITVVANGYFAGQREPIDRRLIFDVAFDQIVLERRGKRRADAQVVDRIIIRGNPS